VNHQCVLQDRVDITESGESNFVVRRLIYVRGLYFCDHTNKIRYSVEVRQFARVSPGVSGLFRRNRILQLAKNGVVEDLLVMNV